MPIDLKRCSDHPAAIIDDFNEAVNGCKLFPTTVANELRQYERDNGVTFAALDNDMLAEVKREYDRYVMGKTNALGAAIDALLGLED